jgi:transposase
MIVTPNKEDYDDEDKRYFLVLNRLSKEKLLRRSFSLIKQILQNVSSIDELHAEMDEIKAQIETDHETEEEKLND